MADFTKISVTTGGEKSLMVDNPTSYPLIGMGAQGAVFKLSEEKCVKIYANTERAKMEEEALKAGQHLSFMPTLYESGDNYVVMDYFNAPDLKLYLKNCTFMPESVARKLLDTLKALRQEKYTMVDAPLRHVFVLENEELKVVDHVHAYTREHPVPIKLLRELKMLLLRESFLMHAEKLEPEMYEEWQEFFEARDLDFREISVASGGSGRAVNVDSALPMPLIGQGHQGAVYRVSEDQCAKIYGKEEHAKQEQEVLVSCQDLPFIPKVFETSSNYVLMEYLLGPDLNSFLKKQRSLPEEVTRQLLDILKTMEERGFKQIDAPLRHTIITKEGYKLIDHVYSFSREQDRPLELFDDLHQLDYLDAFLEQVQAIDPETYNKWTETPIPLRDEERLPNYTGPHIKDFEEEYMKTPEQIAKELVAYTDTPKVNSEDPHYVVRYGPATEEKPDMPKTQEKDKEQKKKEKAKKEQKKR
ncbi:hypothetical protein [Salsuginibacillus kocurii]|uniref:hypothetical protein n=1 Tax=Salsuginibacillus kocurii TaxID=427078 RepID=UPI00035DFAC2|nr:hypothetical protein [Salsuginibacillus kocurii]